MCGSEETVKFLLCEVACHEEPGNVVPERIFVIFARISVWLSALRKKNVPGGE